MPFSKRIRFHVWTPNIFEFKGGIQVYSAVFLEALQHLYLQADYDIFFKHDTGLAEGFSFLSQTRYHFAGTWVLPLRTAVFATQILRFGLWQRPSLVLTTHLNFTPAAYWLKRLVGVPYWTVAHGVEAWNIKRPALQQALHHADRILCVSHYTRDRLLKEQMLDPAKLSLLPNTIDANRFQILPKPQHLLKRYRLTAEQPIILTVARLESTERYKGYDQILYALPEIRRTLPNVHYILVGKGSDRSRVEQLVTQLNLQDCVTLAGFVPDEELCAHYNLCDVFAMPSKGEGFGIVYLEALSCGKPTVGGNQDGAIDALCQGELGVLVNPDDVREIAHTLIQILQGAYPHPLLYQSKLLRQKVIERYGFDRFQQTLAELLESAELGVYTELHSKR
ncbi:MAG TPA: glycosyltransferase [Cyanophyceae cyanobacterium]